MKYLFIRGLDFIIIVALMAAVLNGTFAHAATIDGVVAVVDDDVVMLSDLISKARSMGLDVNDTRALHAVLQVMVENIIVEKTCEEMGIPSPDNAQVKGIASKTGLDLNDARFYIMKETLMDVVVRSRVVVTENMIREYYKSQPEYNGLLSAKLAQILIKDNEEKVNSAMNAIKGDQPFDEVAGKYSDVLIHGSSEMGWIPIKDLLPEVKSVIDKSKKGDIVGPIKSGKYVFIFRVLDKGVQGKRPLKSVRGQIKDMLEKKYRKEAFEHWMKTVMDKHFIGIYI